MQIPESERLTFEYCTAKDAEFLWSVDQDEAVMQYINGGKKTPRDYIDGVMIPRLQAFSNPTLGWGLWKVANKEHPLEGIGWILVRPMHFFTSGADTNNLELGWRFKRSSWGKGFAFEAALAVRNALCDMGVEQFSAIADEDNMASIRIMEKLGMTFSHKEHYKDALFDGEVVVYTQTCRFGCIS